MNETDIQPALKEHAGDLAQLINLAGEGLPKYLWQSLSSSGQDPMETGKERALREEGGFSYRNARVCMTGTRVQGMIIAYQQPTQYAIDDIETYPDVVKPLILLESKAPGSWYINAIATFEQYQGKGIAQKLLSEAEAMALSGGVSEMSLIVASENARAKALYDYLGYKVIDALPVVEYPGCLHGGDWILMIKKLS